MRHVPFVVFALALIGLVAGCRSGSGAGQDLALGSAPWKDGDKLVYDIVDRNGKSVGTSEFGFALADEAWLLSFSDKTANLEQSAQVRVDGKTLKPLGEEKTIKTASVDAKVSTSYDQGRLEVKAVQNGQNKAAAIDVPADAIENDQLLRTLRALPFAEGYEAKFVTVVGQNVAKIDTTVRVTGREQVAVSAGDFEAWKVELDFGQAKQQAWYQVDEPHNLVQYDNGNTKMLLKSS